MKSIIYLGIALVAVFQNANAETTLVSGINTDLSFVTSVKAEQYQKSLLGEIIIEHKKMAPVEDAVILNPETVLIGSNQKSLEAMIAEDRKITESKIINDGILYFSERTTEEIISADNQIIDGHANEEVQMLFIERTIEDQIAEDNSIIESNLPNEAQVLDFDSINRNSVLVKQIDTKKVLGMN